MGGQLLRNAQQLSLFSASSIGHLLVEPIDGVPGWPWCVHGSAPHSAWIELYKSREEAEADARAMLERGRR
jgi:hypothetical protein